MPLPDGYDVGRQGRKKTLGPNSDSLSLIFQFARLAMKIKKARH